MNPPIDNIGNALTAIMAFGTPVPHGTVIKIEFCVYDIVQFKAGNKGKYVWLVDKAASREDTQLLSMMDELHRSVNLFRVTVFNNGKMQFIKLWKTGDLVCITVRPTLSKKVCQGTLEAVIQHESWPLFDVLTLPQTAIANVMIAHHSPNALNTTAQQPSVRQVRLARGQGSVT
ncbi:Aste57867_25562 [Aphanomyces stellatus]|uniref:Aste57867_25562 protein n=1 Tax=Aphanomyces stellatus TaxID=120398 RepID=A0A485LTJ4_9STRA|nr:hypothetical protein As57867_025483 [Aphanomyces stellatus]VFU02185.1 Aste57867_25562 [Aphanomyces stellatus]